MPQDSSTGGAVQPAPQLDPEQLRQFQQFQQFQDFLRYSEAQRQGGGEVVPTRSAPGYGVQVPGQGAPPMQPPYGQLQPAPPPLPAPRPQIKVPRWAKRLAGKLLSAFLFLLVLIIAGTLAYRHFFPDDDPDLPAAQIGGGTYHTNRILSPNPFDAARQVYQQTAQGLPDEVCTLFETSAEQKFADDLGYPDCRAAVLDLETQVTDVTAYAGSLPFGGPLEPGTTELRIDSCSYDISGGPALGVFTVRKVELNQWQIVDHEPGPKTCPVPSTPTSR